MRILLIALFLSAVAQAETIPVGASGTFTIGEVTLDKNGNVLPTKPGYKIYESCVPKGATGPVSKVYDLGVDVKSMTITPMAAATCDYSAAAYNLLGESPKTAIINLVVTPAPTVPAAPVAFTFRRA